MAELRIDPDYIELAGAISSNFDQVWTHSPKGKISAILHTLHPGEQFDPKETSFGVTYHDNSANQAKIGERSLRGHVVAFLDMFEADQTDIRILYATRLVLDLVQSNIHMEDAMMAQLGLKSSAVGAVIDRASNGEGN